MNNRYLLDTNVVVRLDRQCQQMPPSVLQFLIEPNAELFVSAASFWELAIKQGLRKIDKGPRLEAVLRTYGMQELPVT